MPDWFSNSSGLYSIIKCKEQERGRGGAGDIIRTLKGRGYYRNCRYNFSYSPKGAGENKTCLSTNGGSRGIIVFYSPFHLAKYYVITVEYKKTNIIELKFFFISYACQDLGRGGCYIYKRLMQIDCLKQVNTSED